MKLKTILEKTTIEVIPATFLFIELIESKNKYFNNPYVPIEKIQNNKSKIRKFNKPISRLY